MEKIETESATAGDIVAMVGIAEMTIGDTLTSPENIFEMTRISIEPPTVSMDFMVNDSALGEIFRLLNQAGFDLAV